MKKPMFSKEFIAAFAADWIDAWNSHDLQRILSHYSEDFEMTSPLVAILTGEDSGKLKGKEVVGAYWRKALDLNPNLRFELIAALAGVNSITLYYQGHRGQSAEVFHFGEQGNVTFAFAHYENLEA